MLEREEFVNEEAFLGAKAEIQSDQDSQDHSRPRNKKALRDAMDSIESHRLLRSQVDGRNYQEEVQNRLKA